MNVVVGCYTPGAYARVAEEHLLKSVKMIGLDYDVRLVENQGSWLKNINARQQFLRRLHDEYPDKNLLYLDADAEVHSNPWGFLNSQDCDVAVHYFKGHELLGSAIYLPNGPNRKNLLDKWIARNEQCPQHWDQRNLQEILEGSEFRVCRLPPEYNCIFDLQRFLTPAIVPVIEQFQASRQYKDDSWSMSGAAR